MARAGDSANACQGGAQVRFVVGPFTEGSAMYYAITDTSSALCTRNL
jgi:hypothetical protein